MVQKATLKAIRGAAVERALEKADRYRLLNDPEQAESICLDVLGVEADSVRAKRTLLLALTDQFATSAVSSKAKLARQLAGELPDEYERHYYAGLISEREARAYLAKGLSGSFAYEAFEEAMQHFEEAEKVRPEDDDESILRYNACLRAIVSNDLEPRGDERELPLE
jgi:tetratricopeptide (TPR) repeat protein